MILTPPSLAPAHTPAVTLMTLPTPPPPPPSQELSLRRALLLAYALNRTLILPPLLRQSDLAFGPPEKRCAHVAYQSSARAGDTGGGSGGDSTAVAAGGDSDGGGSQMLVYPGLASLHERAEIVYLNKLQDRGGG